MDIVEDIVDTAGILDIVDTVDIVDSVDIVDILDTADTLDTTLLIIPRKCPMLQAWSPQGMACSRPGTCQDCTSQYCICQYGTSRN